MGKAVLISIRPEWCEEIILRNKTMEVRKNSPKLETPFKVYVYCTSVKSMKLQDYVEVHKATSGAVDDWSCKVIGEFICDKIEIVDIPYPAYQSELDKRFIEESRVSYYALHSYAFHDSLFFWHISDLKIYDNPKPLSRFSRYDFCSMNGTDVCGNEKCEHYKPSGSYMEPPTCDINGCLLWKPPQSWCYVTERVDE